MKSHAHRNFIATFTTFVVVELKTLRSIATLVIVLAYPWWVTAAVYACLRVTRAAQSGVPVALCLLAMGSFTLWAFVCGLIRIVQTGKRLSSLRRRGAAGNEEAMNQFCEARRARVLPWQLFAGLINFQFMIPMAVASVLWSQTDLSGVAISPKVAIMLRLHDLDQTIAKMEKHGLFTPL